MVLGYIGELSVDDSEARYLIDQFNKYASWSVSHWINILPYVAILVSVFALSFSLPETGWEVPLLSDPMLRLYLPLGVILLAIGASLSAAWKYNQETHSFEERLFVLERYRSKHKSLPDEVTFEWIVKSKPEDLEKLLAVYEREKRT